MESIRISLKFEACLTVEVEGRSGGLAEDWRLSCYYGFPDRSRRKLAWDMLRDVRNMSNMPWCIIGDFNDLLSQEDKRGIHPHPNWLCSVFRQAISDCDLVDSPLICCQFTWVKSRGSEHMIEEILDRAFATPEWLNLFPTVSLTNLIASYSDHSPILLSCKIVQTLCRDIKFRFENS
ncbi:uncharacterized protein LOC131636004 [Vicia villosa]|uniref:uncharacterized protein LOC131636004 n=1 Tax=Vicia villosa TaxID=3911 RepID=UPI00273CB613|nr:uncharacterized protein LOC131636004 [Vicia villosa]